MTKLLFLLVAGSLSAASHNTIPMPWLEPIAYTATAVLDYHSTIRAQNALPNGVEANPILACGRELCVGRFVLINGGVVFGIAAINSWVLPKLPPRPRKAIRIMTLGMIGGRTAVIIRNYRLVGNANGRVQ